jgi:aquaporin Z
MAREPTFEAKLTAEFIGTFLLIFTVGCNVLGGAGTWAGVSIASVLMVSIYALGGISGANFNPAVTFTLWMVNAMGGPGGMDTKTAGAYIATQVAAGVVAALGYSALFWDTFNLVPAKDFSLAQAGLCEMLYTFMLCFVVLNAAVAKQTMYYGLAIGYVIVAGAYGAGAVSGGCFNPAVAIGIDTSSAGLGFGWCAIYTVFEIIGAAMAAVAFKIVRPGQFGGNADPGLGGKMTSEFLGTYFLVLTVGLNVLGSSSAAAFSIAASLMCMIYALGDVSGAHFNPAVTLAISACGRDKISSTEVMQYMAAQVGGGIAAATTYSLIYGGKTFGLMPGVGYGWVEAAMAEIVFTFVLCYVVLSVAISEKTAAPEFFGLAIGSCVTVGGFAIGAVSGGSLNPAVSAGIAATNFKSAWTMVPYALFEFVGAFAAAQVFSVTHAADLDGKDISA